MVRTLTELLEIQRDVIITTGWFKTQCQDTLSAYLSDKDELIFKEGIYSRITDGTGVVLHKLHRINGEIGIDKYTLHAFDPHQLLSIISDIEEEKQS